LGSSAPSWIYNLGTSAGTIESKYEKNPWKIVASHHFIWLLKIEILFGAARIPK
jgi:hypothetical protein